MRQMDENSAWWDDKSTTDVVETRDDIMRNPSKRALPSLKEILANDPAEWNWGEMHASTFRNGTLGESGVGLIEALFNRGPFPTGGGESIVNATGWSVRDGYETNWLPSMRMIVDLGDLNNSLTVHTTGQSGHAYHPHYIDMARCGRISSIIQCCGIRRRSRRTPKDTWFYSRNQGSHLAGWRE
jgi:penicillin G amidase